MPWPIYDTHEDIPEAFRGEYEERDENGVKKWHPKLPDVTGAQTALQRERERAEKEEQARKKAERDLVELRRQQAAKDGNISDEQLQKLRDEDAKARKPIEEENERLKAENRKLKLTDRVRTTALTKGVLPDRIEDAMLLLESRTDLTSDGNDIVVKDKTGNITTEKLEVFLEKTFKQEKPWLYKGSGASGSGADDEGDGSGGGSGSGTPPKLLEPQIAAKRSAVAGAF